METEPPLYTAPVFTKPLATVQGESSSPPFPSLTSPEPSVSPGAAEVLSDIAVNHLANGAEPILSQIMEAIQHSHASFTMQIDSVKMELSFLKQGVHNIKHWVSNAEQQISELEDSMQPLDHQMTELKHHSIAASEKLNYLEDCLRRNNLQLLGFPEGTEGKRPKSFMEKWLTDTFGTANVSFMFAINVPTGFRCAPCLRVHLLALF